MDKLTPIESAFATTQEAEAYDRWFRARVQAILDDPRPNIPHATVMAERDIAIAEAERQQKG